MSGSSRELSHPAAEDFVLTDVLFALSDPARLTIARQLVNGPLEIADCQPADGEIPKSTLSHHLKTLREAGIVRNLPDGRRRRLHLRREELERRFPGLLDAVLGPAATERQGRPDHPAATERSDRPDHAE